MWCDPKWIWVCLIRLTQHGKRKHRRSTHVRFHSSAQVFVLEDAKFWLRTWEWPKRHINKTIRVNDIAKYTTLYSFITQRLNYAQFSNNLYWYHTYVQHPCMQLRVNPVHELLRWYLFSSHLTKQSLLLFGFTIPFLHL